MVAGNHGRACCLLDLDVFEEAAAPVGNIGIIGKTITNSEAHMKAPSIPTMVFLFQHKQDTSHIPFFFPQKQFTDGYIKFVLSKIFARSCCFITKACLEISMILSDEHGTE